MEDINLSLEDFLSELVNSKNREIREIKMWTGTQGQKHLEMYLLAEMLENDSRVPSEEKVKIKRLLLNQDDETRILGAKIWDTYKKKEL